LQYGRARLVLGQQTRQLIEPAPNAQGQRSIVQYIGSTEHNANADQPDLLGKFCWKNIVLPPQSAVGRALNYLQEEWPQLIRYLDDGLIPIDNNLTENAIRPFTVGRKNWFSVTVWRASSPAPTCTA
jgi:hypothetical protein